MGNKLLFGLLFLLTQVGIVFLSLQDWRLICDHDGYYLDGFAGAVNEADGKTLDDMKGLPNTPYPGVNILLEVHVDPGLMNPYNFRIFPSLI